MHANNCLVPLNAKIECVSRIYVAFYGLVGHVIECEDMLENINAHK